MHNSLLFALWAAVSFVLYKIIASIIESRRHAANARRLGCQPAYQVKDRSPLSIHSVWKVLQADKEFRVPQYLKDRMDRFSKEEHRTIATISQRVMGAQAYFTMEPRNIQAVLATQFKDFGLGERRNGNFSPLLGHGIVSDSRGSQLLVDRMNLTGSSFPPMAKNGSMPELYSDHSLPAIKSVTWNWKNNTFRT